MSPDDKQDMLEGLIPDEALECHIRCWMEAGMPDYANGDTRPYKPKEELPMNRYRGMGKDQAS